MGTISSGMTLYLGRKSEIHLQGICRRLTVCNFLNPFGFKDERECKSLSTVTFLLIQNHERIEIRKIEIVNRLCPFSSWLNVNMSSQILSLSSFVSVYIFFALVRM